MNISNPNFFVSLFNSCSSGTAEFRFKRLKIEVDVKHSEYDWGRVPLTLWSIEKYPTTTVIFNWIPVKHGCQGIRINLFWRNQNEN